MALDSTLAAGLDAPAHRAFIAVKIVLRTGATIRLLDGSATVTFNSETYTGRDATYGMLGALDPLVESVANEAPVVNLQLLVSLPSAITTLCSASNQGSQVSVYWGIVNYATGAPVGTPELLWQGKIDTMRPLYGDRMQSVEIQTVSSFDRLFQADEGARFNGTWHKSIWGSAETGLDRIVMATRNVLWGAPDSNPNSGTGGGSVPVNSGIIDPATGGYCVAADAFLASGKRAGKARAGDRLTVLNYSTMSGHQPSKIDRVSLASQPCQRLITDNGIELVCSLSTPLTLPDGSVVFEKDVLGQKLATLDHGVFAWRSIVSADRCGIHEVALIEASNQTYAAGTVPGRSIFTHNIYNDKSI